MTKSNKSNSSDKSYSTGYKQPPKQHQFAKGQSGNPNGRPKGSKNVSTLIQEELEQSIIVQEQGQQKEIKKSEAIVKQMVMKALKGDIRATEFIFKLLPQDATQDTDTMASFAADPRIVENLLKRLSHNGGEGNERE